jgi:hypothetical protein
MSSNIWKTVFRPFVSGAAITLGSTAISCVGALYVERTAHRALYRWFPHLYSNVEQAFGLEDYELAAVRGMKAPSSLISEPPPVPILTFAMTS